MAIERTQAATSLVDVLDRVLDKGIVIDAWVRVSVVGIDLITVEARVVVASIATYLQYSETVAAETSPSVVPTTTVRRRPQTGHGHTRSTFPSDRISRIVMQRG